jgi:hypothetical protein
MLQDSSDACLSNSMTPLLLLLLLLRCTAPANCINVCPLIHPQLLTSKLERLTKNANTSEAVQELEEEITALRRLLKCNVCHTRQKDVIITKCWHMFCKQCIAKNLEARHRKCPGCGHQFGQADVKQFFFT